MLTGQRGRISATIVVVLAIVVMLAGIEFYALGKFGRVRPPDATTPAATSTAPAAKPPTANTSVRQP